MAGPEQHEAVAIVGMGCRWPGGVRNAPELWEFLVNKVDGWREFDEPQFSTRGFYHPNSDRPGTMSMRGAFLADEDARLFDHSFFGMTRLEVDTLDPSQRKLLEVTYEAIENAGETWESVSGSRTGVFVGNFCLDHWMIQSRDWDNPRPYAFTGAGTSILANRISYIFNFQGPSLTVDTACSSSMYALHLAVSAIRAGDCDSAIVASANWIADPGVQIALDKLGALSASSRCHTFDARAEGYARGEGYGAIYLKRPSLAIEQQSPIRAMIRGTAINSNGRTGGITRPSATGQETVIREAYRNAGNLSFADTNYFECHGTGTYVGDPIEVAAVGRVFAPERKAGDALLVGSVKSNLGHGEGASALASIMKVVLSLEHGAIPPVYDLQTLNPNIDFEGANVKPVTQLTPWPSGMRRASINSFGYGGANGHAIIDHVNNVLPDYVAPGIFKAVSNGANVTANGAANDTTNGHQESNKALHYPVIESPKLVATVTAATRQLVLLPFSGHNENSISSNIEKLSEVINHFSLADVAYTLSARRSRLPQRSFRIVDKNTVDKGLAVERKPARAPLQTTNIGFIFTGQGAQWHAMGTGLFEYRVFEETILYLDHVLSLLPDGPPWSLQDMLSGNCDQSLVHIASVSQAICTAVQIGLVDLLASWSVRPSGVAGHSSGEMAAAYASGRITAAEAILAAYYRGQAVSRNNQIGAMLAVGLGVDQVAKYTEGRDEEIRVAAINSSGSVTLSGETTAVDEISASLTADNVFNRKLKTGGNAYHSHHMLPLGREYIKLLTTGLEHIKSLGVINDEKHRYQEVPWISSVTPEKSTASLKDWAPYWRANLESPVLFSQAVGKLFGMEDVPIQAALEIGPHPALKGSIEQILKAENKTAAYASTLRRQEASQVSILELAGNLFTLNAPIDLVTVNAMDKAGSRDLEHGCTNTDLPPYQYTYAGLNYHESRASKEYRYRSIVKHDLLGSKVIGNAKLRPQWRNILRKKDVPWLNDHCLGPDAVLPAAGYMTMATEAAKRVYDEFSGTLAIEGFSLQNVAIKKSLTIPDDDYGVEVLTSMELGDTSTAPSPTWATFSISSVGRETEEWLEHCTGLVKIEVDEVDAMNDLGGIDTITSPPRRVDTKAWYKKFAAIGLSYGPTFQPLSNIRAYSDKRLAVADVSLDTTAGVIPGGESIYPLHPASLDGAIQLGLVAAHGGRPGDASTAFVPVYLSRLYLANGITSTKGTAIGRGEKQGIRAAYLDLQIRCPNNKVVLSVESLRCISYSIEARSLDNTFSSPYTRLVWKPDIRTLENSRARQMYPPPEENVEKSPKWGITNKLAHFVVYSIYEIFGEVDGLKPGGEVGHFFDWVKRKGANDHSLLMSEARQLASQGRLLEGIDDLVAQAPDVMEVKIAKLLHANMSDILHEKRTGVDVIIGEDLLTPLYQSGLLMTGIYPQLHKVLDGIAHSNPNLRILEIGGGTGGATRIAMKAFSGPNGIKAYNDYTFTDISAGFLSSARESLAEFGDMHFSVFNIEATPEEQGYEQAYDLVIACQVLHATSNMHATLSNCRKLLRPGGRLVMVETNQNFIVPGVVVGTFTGYWAGIPDGRVDAPFQDLDAWETSLQKAGFSGLDVVLNDFPEPHNTTSVILSTYTPDREEPLPGATVHVLYGDDYSLVLADQISEEFKQRRVAVKAGPLDEALDTVGAESRVVAILDAKHLLIDGSEQALKVFQHLARNVTSLLAVTSCGIARGRNPDGALIPGLLRVLQTENPVSQYLSIDIDADNFSVANSELQDLARSIADQELALQQNPQPVEEGGNLRDLELCWQDGSMWVSRHVPDAGFHSKHGINRQSIKPELLPLGKQKPLRATFEIPGVVNSLCFESYTELSQPLPRDFIDVKVEAIGLNRRDLDCWLGRLDANGLSSEYAGIISAVGAKVGDLQVGDRVYGLGEGQFGNYTRVPAAFAKKLQPGDDMVQMATIPWAYMTATLVFDHVAPLRSGQTVLIQSNGGDVGFASIRFAISKGAVVFALVETPEQAAIIESDLLIPASHILVSPTMTTLRRAAEMTRKNGFDVILRTTDGHNLQTLSRVLAPFGYLIDLVQTNAVNFQLIALDLTQKNAAYRSIDPSITISTDPLLGKEIMQAIDAYYRKGMIGPIERFTASDISQLSQVLSEFSSIIGKLVVTFANPESRVRMIPSAPGIAFDPDAYYIVTGAFGGLGQSMIRWMGNRGARHLAVLSRRSINSIPGAQDFIESLAKRDIRVEPFVCDVTDKNQVINVVQKVSSSHPIKGVVHAAVSYLDLSFDKVPASRWNDGLSAKVHGTKNLHEATLGIPLDFFVMTTSALSVYAFATQGAYTAANNFQDAFARYRQRIGLAASTTSFSLVHEVTDVGTDTGTVDLFERNKTLTLDESQFLTYLEPAFLNNKTAVSENPEQWGGKVEDPLSAANLHTYLDPAAMMARKLEEKNKHSSSALPRWYSDARVSLIMRAFSDAQQHADSLTGSLDEGSKNTVTVIRSGFDAAVQRGAGERTSTVEYVLGVISNAVAEMLFVDVEGIDPSKSVADLGVDSLIAAELRNWFHQALATNISMLDLLEPSVSIKSRAEAITDKALAINVESSH